MANNIVYLTENVAIEELSDLLNHLISALNSQMEVQNLKLYPPIETCEGWFRSGQLVLKELPEWLFGFDLCLNQKSITFFGEHRWLIDKFKSSRCYVSYEELGIADFDNRFNEVLMELKEIQAHPIRHFGYSLYYGDSISDEQAQKEYAEMKFERRFNKRFDKQIQNRLFNFFKRLPQSHSDILAVGVIDQYKALNSRVYPRYMIRVLVEKETEESVIDLIYSFIQTLDAAGVFKGDYVQFGLEGIYDELKDLKKCHYVYKKKPQTTLAEGGN